MQFADMTRNSKTPEVLAALALAVACWMTMPAFAQSPPQTKALSKKAFQPVPPPGELNAIVRTTLRKLNRNNKANLYEELHEHLTPQLQMSITPEKLGEAFSGFRSRGIDISSVAQVEPQFLKQPVIDEQGVLLMTGIFPLKPRLVYFNLGYRKIDGVWMLEGFQINTPTEREWLALQEAQKRAEASRNQARLAGEGAGAEAAKAAPALDMSTDPPTAMRW